MLEKANDQDLEGLSPYTIRNLDSKIVTGSDISQYKLMNVKEAPIDNRQEHLYLLCFPTLFPTGQYGEHHPRQSYRAIQHESRDRTITITMKINHETILENTCL